MILSRFEFYGGCVGFLFFDRSLSIAMFSSRLVPLLAAIAIGFLFPTVLATLATTSSPPTQTKPPLAAIQQLSR
ncbi:MAG: hypothetical protein F6J87_03420 [Spirulina sp. SIO3F2]|nr:hypothetical protein [Spirulina sp. SIO3F2]